MAAKLGLVLVVVCTLYVQTYAQANCAPALTGLVPCLPYITGNSSTPVPMCCTQLSAVVQSQPQCLCLVLGSNAGSALGISVNQTQALALPNACNVKTPSPTLCSTLAGAPTGSPAPAAAPPTTGSAPAASPVGTPPASTPGTTTKPAAASPGPSASGSSMNSASSLMAVAAIVIVSCASALGAF
ncbi:Non-specific lipid transfer protein GPI-anchored 2 [Nymphaea thermarum]|nr:Non-specific lipid transfer protein GPI-anchored 2 [Nymphaea thermarum]